VTFESRFVRKRPLPIAEFEYAMGCVHHGGVMRSNKNSNVFPISYLTEQAHNRETRAQVKIAGGFISQQN
jgi:hypothetical protein